MKNKKTAFLDILGISSAGLCMVHCLIFPLLTFIPIGLRNDSLIDLVFALVGLWAVIRIVRNANLMVIVILLNSITLIIVSILIEIYMDIHSNFIYWGGFGMIVGHFLNYKSQSKNSEEE